MQKLIWKGMGMGTFEDPFLLSLDVGIFDPTQAFNIYFESNYPGVKPEYSYVKIGSNPTKHLIANMIDAGQVLTIRTENAVEKTLFLSEIVNANDGVYYLTDVNGISYLLKQQTYSYFEVDAYTEAEIDGMFVTLEKNMTNYVDDKVSIVNQDIEDVKRDLTSLDEKHDLDVERIDGEIRIINETDTVIKEDIINLEEKDLLIDENIEGLKLKDISLKEDIDTLEEKVDLIKEGTDGDFGRVDGEIALLKQEDTNIKNTMENESNRLDGEITALKGEVTRLDLEDDSIKESISGLEQEDLFIKQEISFLKQEDLDIKEDLTTHKNNKDNPHVVTKSQVGLGNVDNTSDKNKPLSDAEVAALKTKGDKVDVEKNAADIVQLIIEDENIKTDIINLEDNQQATVLELQEHIGDELNPHKVTKAQVGLGNADDTSDKNKPVSDATKTEIDKKLNKDFKTYVNMLEVDDANILAIQRDDEILHITVGDLFKRLANYPNNDELEEQLLELINLINTKANDDTVVKLTGNQTIADIKTFTGSRTRFKSIWLDELGDSRITLDQSGAEETLIIYDRDIVTLSAGTKDFILDKVLGASLNTELDMSDNVIKNVADGTNPKDVVNKSQLDTKVSITTFDMQMLQKLNIKPNGNDLLIIDGMINPLYIDDTAYGKEHPIVDSQVAMLALDVVAGTVVIRSDLANHLFILSQLPASTLENWQVVSGNSVVSVAGKTGVVVLGITDIVGLDGALNLKLDVTTFEAQMIAIQNALNLKAEKTEVTALDTDLKGLIDKRVLKSNLVNKVYGTDNNGDQTEYDTEDVTAKAGSIVKRTIGGQVRTGTAADNLDALNFGQAKTLLAAKANDNEVVKLTGNQYDILGDKRFDSLQLMNSKGLIFVNDEKRSNGKLQVIGGKLNILESTKNGEIAVTNEIIDETNRTNNELSQAFGGKNLAVPDLEGKEYLGDGVYRIFNNNEITVDYNVYQGYYIVNGVSNETNWIELFRINTKGIHTFTISNINADYTDTSTMIYIEDPQALDLRIYENELVKSKTLDITTQDVTRLLVLSNITFNNYIFRVQMEKGDTATPYTLPLWVTPELLDNKATKTEFNAHKNDKNNPHGVTKSQVGLSNVTNDKQFTRAEFDKLDLVGGTNLALPSKLGKEYLGQGNYRLINSRGITFDYNVYNGVYTLNGTVTGSGFFEILSINLSLNNYNFNMFNYPNDINGTISYELRGGSAGTIYGSFNIVNIERLNVDFSQMILVLIAGNSFDNKTFRIQIEQGDTATPYTLPIQPIIYHETKNKVDISKQVAKTPDMIGRVGVDNDGSLWYAPYIDDIIKVREMNSLDSMVSYEGTLQPNLTHADNGDIRVYSNTFDHVFPFNEMKESVDIFNNKFIHVPVIYWKFYHDTLGNLTGYDISNKKIDDTFDTFPIHTKGKLSIGKYQAYSQDGKLYSISAVEPSMSKNIASFRTEAKAVGDDYFSNDWQSWNMLQLLLTAYFGTKNTDLYFPDVNRAKSNTGTMDGYNTAVNLATGKNIFFGIENIVKNGYHFIDGVVNNNEEVWFANDHTKYSNVITDDYVLKGTKPTQEGYIKNYGGGLGLFPTENTGASSTTYYCDYLWYNSDLRVLLSGSSWGASAYRGVWNWYAYYAFSLTSSLVGSRLIKTS